MSEKKIALVTGGTRGIGKGIVERFGADGYTVCFSYVSSDEKAKKLVEELKEKGIESKAYKCDVASFGDTEKMVGDIVENYGRLDVLVNNAGITRDTLLSRMSEEDFDVVIAANLKGVFNCTKHAAKVMAKQNGGRIISIASVAGLIGNIGQVNYSASKAGVMGMTRTLAAELGRYGITANAIAPGFTKTDMTDVVSDKIKEKMIASTPLRTMGEPADIANAVSFFADDRSRFITGQVLSVDGGLSIV